MAGIAIIYTPSALSSLVAVPLHTPSLVPCSAPLFPPSLRSVGYRGLHCVSLSVMWACTALAVVSALCRYREAQFYSSLQSLSGIFAMLKHCIKKITPCPRPFGGGLRVALQHYAVKPLPTVVDTASLQTCFTAPYRHRSAPSGIPLFFTTSSMAQKPYRLSVLSSCTSLPLQGSNTRHLQALSRRHCPHRGLRPRPRPAGGGLTNRIRWSVAECV